MPLGILNWVISKIVWVKLWYWNFEQPTSSCFSGSIAILFYVKKWTKHLLPFYNETTKEQMQHESIGEEIVNVEM